MNDELYIDNIRNSLAYLLANDEKIYLLGEDIVDPYGGGFKVTKSLSTRFPGRLLPMPMSEQAYTGFAVGMALGGLKPIVEIMFGDFLTLTLDQLLNHASKFCGLYDAKLSLVVRTPMGGHRGYGATHSQSIERILFGIPHIEVISPSILHNPGELLLASVNSEHVIVFIENKLDYSRKLFTNDSSNLLSIKKMGGIYPIAISKIRDADNVDVAIITYGGAVPFALEAQQELFMNDELAIKLICPSHITSLDEKMIIGEIGQCNRVLIAEEGIAEFGWGEHVTILLREAGYRGTIKRIGATKEIIGASEAEENRILLTKNKIEEGIYELLRE